MGKPPTVYEPLRAFLGSDSCRRLIYVTRPQNSTLPAITWLSAAEVADYFGCSKMTVTRWIHSGKLPALQIDRTFRIDEEAVKALIAEATTK